MRIGVRVPPCRPLPEVVAVVRQAEAAGFDTVVMPDSPAVLRSIMMALAVAAVQTDRITLATAVTNVVVQQPIVVASAARTLAEIAPDRCRIGIGVGDSAVFITGNKPSSNRQLRTGIETIRALLCGETVKVGAVDLVLQDPPGPVPIFVAANGPRNLALAVELGDGVITSSRNFAEKAAFVKETARAINRDRPLHFVTNIVGGITDRLEERAQDFKPEIVRYVQKEGPDELRRAGFDVEVPSGHIPLPDGTDLAHARDRKMAIEIASQWISDDVAMWYAQNICLFGTAKEIAERALAFADSGVDEIVFGNGSSFVMPTEVIDMIGGSVIPLIRQLEKS